MKTILTLVLSALSMTSGFTQTEKTGELHTLLEWLETHLKSHKDSTAPGNNAHKAIKIAQKINDSTSLAKSYLYLAHYHREYSKLDSSLAYTLKAQEFYRALKNELELANTHLALKTEDR